MARAADIAARRLEESGTDRDFLEGKLESAHFYATQVLPHAMAFEQIVKTGSDAVIGADASII